MGQVANNLVDLAEYRARKARETARTKPFEGNFVPPIAATGFPVGVPMMAVPYFWVPVWVPVIAPVHQLRAESGHA